MWVRGHWKSLKVVSFESLVTVSYSPSIVTMAASVAVCEIFSVKCGMTLKTGSGLFKVIENGTIFKLFAHNTLRVSICLNISPWPWNVGYGSLKVIESGIIWKFEYGFLFAFHSNYDRIFSHFGDIQRKRMAWPWNLGLGYRRSRSLTMACFDRPCMTFY